MLLYNLKAVAKKMDIDFKEITSKIEHPSEMGTAREELLKTYLSDFLPIKYTVGNGFVMDFNERKSKQQDFIIYDAFNSPLMLKMQSLQIVPIESVYCTIEIKSTLTKDELQKCVNNIKSVRSLEKCRKTTKVLMLGIDKTIGCVFAYTSDISLEKLLEHFKEMNKDVPKEHQISFICVLDKGLIYNVDKDGMTGIALYPNENSIPVRSEKELEDNLSLFYLFVLEHLNRCDLLPPNLIEYAKKQNAFNVKPNLNVRDLPDDGKLNTIMGKISNSELKLMDNNLQSISPYLDKKITSKMDLVNILISSKGFKSYVKANIFHFVNGFEIDFDLIDNIADYQTRLNENSVSDEETKDMEELIDKLYNDYNEKELSKSAQ